MKKLFAALLALTMTVTAFAGCSDSDTVPDGEESVVEDTTIVATKDFSVENLTEYTINDFDIYNVTGGMDRPTKLASKEEPINPGEVRKGEIPVTQTDLDSMAWNMTIDIEIDGTVESHVFKVGQMFDNGINGLRIMMEKADDGTPWLSWMPADGYTSENEPILGQWTLVDDADTTLELLEDGSYIYTEDGQQEKGRFTLYRDKLLLQDNEDWEVGTFIVTANEIDIDNDSFSRVQ